MAKYPESNEFAKLLDESNRIVVIQADNPDSDSLASALALDSILSNLGKQVYLYCGVDIPSYLKYIKGADRVLNEMPSQFDMSIIVDTSSDSLLEQLNKSGEKNWLAAKPTVIIDHHATAPTITFANLIVNHQAVATTEVIYEIANDLSYELNKETAEYLAIGILSDSLGLSSESTSARSIHIVAELVEKGVDLAQLENARRESMRRDPELISYKGQLLERVEFLDNGRIACVTIPQAELDKYSPLYNPPMLVIDDMRLVKGVDFAVAFKTYNDGKITAKIRCNYGVGVAGQLAEHFGGGGHPYASGFKIQDGRTYDEIKAEFVKVASELLSQGKK